MTTYAGGPPPGQGPTAQNMRLNIGQVGDPRYQQLMDLFKRTKFGGGIAADQPPQSTGGARTPAPPWMNRGPLQSTGGARTPAPPPFGGGQPRQWPGYGQSQPGQGPSGNGFPMPGPGGQKNPYDFPISMPASPPPPSGGTGWSPGPAPLDAVPSAPGAGPAPTPPRVPAAPPQKPPMRAPGRIPYGQGSAPTINRTGPRRVAPGRKW